MRKIKVLVVDDEEVVRSTISTALAYEGYTPHSARSATEAIQLLGKLDCDVVISDMLMPEKDGIEFISELQREFPRVKIIAISGALPALKWVETPNILTLEKPFDIATLVSTVERALQP